MESSHEHAPAQHAEVHLEIEPLSFGSYAASVLNASGVALGLSLLWILEIGRDAVFKVLDVLNIRAGRVRRASAFPPGRPRRRTRSR